VKTVPNDSHFG